jgi:ubiquinone/menaquinone biosynthesis C-methylase UbiE
MNEILPRQVQESDIKSAYSKVAWFYNFWSWLTESKAAKTVLDFAEIKDGERILEVAVGTGPVFAGIVRRNQHGVSEGVDISESMLRRANRRMKDYPKERYHLQIGSAYKLPFESETFDLLVNNFMLDLLPEKDFVLLLSEYKRVLKPGGRLVLSTMTFGRKWHNKIWDWMAVHAPSVLTGCRPVNIAPYVKQAGFKLLQSVFISQNTFPSEVLKANVPDNPA